MSCPGCGESVAPDDNFCATCGEDVSALEPGPLTACPACDSDVDPDDNFCATCGEDLDAHRSGGAETDASADDTAANEPGGSAAAPSDGQGADASEAGADASGSAASGDADAGADAGTDSGGAGEGPESLVLVVRNREVQVWDGDTVGRTIRSIVMNTGGDEDDALSIHREHVQFVREDGQFHLVALGKNPTVVNGRSLDEGDRVPVSPGDRIELSGVATMRVRTP
ncbi:zinc ribbon domain-containing protein [Halosimplex aquaticum]